MILNFDAANMNAKYFAPIFLLLLMSGCTALKPISPHMSSVESPPIGQITERELGDTLIDKGIINRYETVETLEPIEAKWGIIGSTLRAEPGTFIAYGENRKGVFYKSQKPIMWKSSANFGFGEGQLFVPHNP